MAIAISYQAGMMDSAFGKKQAPIAAMLERRIEEWEKNSQLKNIFKMKQSTHFAEIYTSFTSGEGFAPVDEGGAYPNDDFQESYDKQIADVEWKDQFQITRKAVEDGRNSLIEGKAKRFTDLYGRVREQFSAAMFWGGVGLSISFGRSTIKQTFSTAGADGVAYFSTAHPSKTGKYADQSNLFANAFNVTNLSYVQEKMFKFRDDNGELLDLMPDTIIAGTNPMLRKAIIAAIGSQLDPDTANNAVNFQAGNWNVIFWPYLDLYAPSTVVAGTGWFLMDSNYALDTGDCAIFQDRAPLTVRSEIAENDNNLWKGRCRFGGGFVDWRGFALSYATSGGTDAAA